MKSIVAAGSIAALLLAASEATAHQSKVVVGRVLDAASGASGRFAIEIAGDDVRLIAVRLGFQPETLSVAVAGETVFHLRSAPLAIAPLVIAADRAFSAVSSMGPMWRSRWMGRFRDEPARANLVPLAPTITSSGGLTVRDSDPVAGGIRYRHVGGRTADETGEVRARGYTIVEVFGTWRVARAAELVLALDNLLDAEWNEARFAPTSRLPRETSPVTELHFTPGAPRSVQPGFQLHFQRTAVVACPPGDSRTSWRGIPFIRGQDAERSFRRRSRTGGTPEGRR